MGRCVIFGTSRPFAPTAPYIHCNPSRPCSLTSLWAGKWSMTIEGRVSLCRAESSAVYFRVYLVLVLFGGTVCAGVCVWGGGGGVGGGLSGGGGGGGVGAGGEMSVPRF